MRCIVLFGNIQIYVISLSYLQIILFKEKIHTEVDFFKFFWAWNDLMLLPGTGYHQAIYKILALRSP
jgi:hypothetical protein